MQDCNEYFKKLNVSEEDGMIILNYFEALAILLFNNFNDNKEMN